MHNPTPSALLGLDAADFVAAQAFGARQIRPKGILAGANITVTELAGFTQLAGNAGTVTSVEVTGANGIGVSGSPITSSGTIGLSLGDITPTSVSTGTLSATGHTTFEGVISTGATGTGKIVYDTSPTLTTPVINNIVPSMAADFAVTQNSVSSFYSVSAGAVDLTLRLNAGAVEIGGSNFVRLGSNNATIQLYTSATANDAIKTVANNAGASMGTQNTLSTGYAGIEYIDNAGATKVFTGYKNGGTGEFRYNNIAASGFFVWKINSSDAMYVSNAKNLLIGASAEVTIGNQNRLQVAGTTAATNSLGISAWSADALGSRIELGKSRGAAIGTNTIVQDGDVVGSLLGYGANGSTFTNLASISMEVDGTPGASADMPGRIVFKTVPDGSGTLTEAMRLSQDQTALFASSIQTGTPTSGTAAAWKLGSHQSTIGLTFSTTDYIEVDVAGVAYKIALAA